MMRNFAAYKSGAVRVRISGEYPERFINFCLTEHIYLWGVKSVEHRLLVWMSLRDFFRIRPVVRRGKVRVKVVRRYGLPFLLARWRGRKVLLGGAGVFLLALYWLSGYIWFLEVQGAKTVSAARIEALVEARGLSVGARLEAVNPKEIERELLLKMPELAWAGVRFTGTKAVVEIVEKVLPKAVGRGAGDLVADKAGIVTECIPLSGERVVKVGDVVQAGEVLIRGKAAEGIVKAKIRYESYGEAPLTQVMYARTGRQLRAVQICFNQQTVILKAADLTEFSAYEIERDVKKVPGWRNSDPAVELTVDVYHELNAHSEQRSAAEAKAAATRNALSASEDLIPEDAYVVDRSVNLLASDDPNLVKIELRIETEEKIGKYIKYNEE